MRPTGEWQESCERQQRHLANANKASTAKNAFTACTHR